MQGHGSGSGASESHGAQSSVKKTAHNKSVDKLKTSLNEAENKTSTYLECRLSELRVRKAEMDKEISALHKKMIENLMADVHDVKIRVQSDDRVDATSQKILEECYKLLNELQHSRQTLLKEQQEYSTAAKKLKVADSHEAHPVPSKDHHEVKAVHSEDPHEAKAVPSNVNYTRKCKDSRLPPVECVEARGHEHASTGNNIQEFDPLMNSKVVSNTIVQHEGSVPRDNAFANNSQLVRTAPGAPVATSTSTTGRADTAAGRAAGDVGVDAAVDTSAAAISQTPIVTSDLPTGVDPGSIDLLLIGNCGNGKSATGNSILGRPAFRRTASSSMASGSSASSIKMESTEFAGKVVNVIDGPSISVSGKITPDEVRNIIEKVEKSLELCKYSFTALLIILKFGERFTKQEIEALRVIKLVLGTDVVSEYGVCVITHGDSFEYSAEEAKEFGEEMTFESWLKEQTGEVTNLFKECNYRCILFDNVTKDVEKRQAQLHKLMEIIPKGKRYSKNMFLQARDSTQDLEMEASLPRFLNDAQREADKIGELIDQSEEIKKNDPEARNIKLKLSVLKDKVSKIRISSVELDSLKMSLELLESKLNMKLQRWQYERDIEMNRGAQGKTKAMSPTPALADQTTRTIDKTPHDSPGKHFNRDTAAPLHFNKDIPTTSALNRDVCVSSDFKSDMSDPLSITANSSLAFSSSTGVTQDLAFNDCPTTPATWQMHGTEIPDQHTEGFVVVNNEMVYRESST